MAGVAESSVSGITSRNVQGAAILTRGNFNVAWSNITVTGAGSAQCGDAVWFENQGNLSVNGMSISNENPGTGSGCLANGAFGFQLTASAKAKITNLTVDAAGAYGRPFKMTASRWNTFNSLTVKNGVQAYNGISIEYYSSHNTFNNCIVTNCRGKVEMSPSWQSRNVPFVRETARIEHAIPSSENSLAHRGLVPSRPRLGR